MNALILLLGLITAPAAWAISGAGNSGHGVGCPDHAGGEIKTVVLHDYYEGKYRYGFTPALGDPKLPYPQKIELVLNRLARLDPDRAQHYREAWQFFEANVRRWPNARLVFIDDSNYVALEKGCELVQLAIQKEPEVPDEKYFTIDDDYWQLMHEDDRAGLVLHEIIYQESLKLGAKDSTKARYFNSLISSAKLETMSFAEYQKLMQTLGFPLGNYPVGGVEYVYGSATFHPNGRLKSGKVATDGAIAIPGSALENGQLPFREGDWLEFGEDGHLQRASVSPTVNFQFGPCTLRPKAADILHFAADGSLQSLEYSDEPPPPPAQRDWEFDRQRRFAPYDPPRMRRPDEYPQRVYTEPATNRRVCVPVDGREEEWVSLQGKEIAEHRLSLEFYPSGVVKEGQLVSHWSEWGYSGVRGIPPSPPYLISADELWVSGGTIHFSAGHPIAFHSSGYVSRGTLKDVCQLNTTDGKQGNFSEGATVTFDEKGRVIP